MTMRIGFVKPDFHIIGGFELALDQLAAGLRSRGHSVEYVTIDAFKHQTDHLPEPVPDWMFRLFPEFFRHVSLAGAFEQLDLSRFDAVLSTQPPSYAVRHPGHVALFYHHAKIGYELEAVAVEAGLCSDEVLLRQGAAALREVDRAYLTPDLPILAGSHHVKRRLARYNGLSDNVSVVHIGMDDAYYHYDGPVDYQMPVCVGRHEFPKRPELFMSAMKCLPGMQGRLVGTGTRTEALKRLDVWLTHEVVLHGRVVDDDALWKHLVFRTEALDVGAMSEALKHADLRSNIEFTGRVNQDQLIREYAHALCVVCPSYEEDYGLTAIEAMAFRKPVIACTDGGGYAELVTDGVDGFIVPPKGAAIAEAIRKLSDPVVASEMGQRAYEKSRSFTWERATANVEAALLNTRSAQP